MLVKGVVENVSPWKTRTSLFGMVADALVTSTRNNPDTATGELSHWVMHQKKSTNIGSDNGLSPVRRQAIIWTNPIILSIRPQGTYFDEFSFKIQKFPSKKTHLRISSAKWRPFFLDPNVLTRTNYAGLIITYQGLRSWYFLLSVT